MFLTPGINIFVSEQQNLFPQHMFPARLNWETFASATMFPSLARPLQKYVPKCSPNVQHAFPHLIRRQRHVLKCTPHVQHAF